MRVALIGFGSVARAFVSLIAEQQRRFPFRIAGAHTLRHGTAYGCPLEFGPAAGSVGEFLDKAQAEVMVELTSLEPETGEPALTHIREAFARGMHVVTANKGPLAHSYAALRTEAAARGVQFRYESTVMDGAPVFNMAQERTFDEGVAEARELGITEADPSAVGTRR